MLSSFDCLTKLNYHILHPQDYILYVHVQHERYGAVLTKHVD